MKNIVLNMEEKISRFFNEYGRFVLIASGIGFLTYFMMMSLNLVNDLDGIWHLSNFIAGDWEISLGRGLQRYADRARFGIVSDSFNSMLTIIVIAITNTIIVKKYEFDGIFYKLLFITILMANPIVCNSLSYSYMSVNFGLAYFFSVMAFVCVKTGNENRRKKIFGTFSGAVFLGISMAFYQAYICVTCVLLLSYMIKLLIEEKKVKSVFYYACSSLGLILVGGIFYLLITKALLFRAGIQMASYKGASNMSIGLMLRSLPESIEQCYLQFINFVWGQKMLADLEFINIVLLGLGVVYIVAICIRFFELLKSQVMSAVIFLVMLGLLPVASCAVLLIAVGNTMSVLMSLGIVLGIVILGIVVPREGKTGFWLKRIYLFALVALAWFQLSAVENDQLALKEGKTATITLTENIISEIYHQGYLEEQQYVAFVGRPGDNDRFAQSTAYRMANGYAKFGCWSTDARNNRVSWNGIISNFIGTNLYLCDDAEYQRIIGLQQVADMPEYPMEGSICIIDNIIVVKVSDVY